MKKILALLGALLCVSAVSAQTIQGPIVPLPVPTTQGGTGNTTGTATINANLTGPITSVGNATSIASQTGTGTKFVVDTSPTLVTPAIGAATATSLVASGNVTAAALIPTGSSVPANGMYLSAANTLNFSTNSTANRLTIDANGSVGIGAAGGAQYGLYLGRNMTGAAGAYGFRTGQQIQSDVTSSAWMFSSAPATAATSFTLTELDGFYAGQGTIGAGSTVTSQIGFQASSALTGATNNYGFYGNIASASGRWNAYMVGTAQNAFAGLTRFGGVTVPVNTVDITGTLGATGAVTFSGLGTDAAATDTTLCLITSSKLVATGTGTLGICLGTSSARYKRDIVPMKDGLTEVVKLRPVNFRYKAGHGDGGAREQYGLLAEHVATILPKLVSRDRDGAPSSVDLLGMVPVLIRAVQEEAAQIALLKTQIAALKHHH